MEGTEDIGMNGPQFLENMMKLNEQVASLTDEKGKKSLKQQVKGNTGFVKIYSTLYYFVQSFFEGVFIVTNKTD